MMSRRETALALLPAALAAILFAGSSRSTSRVASAQVVREYPLGPDSLPQPGVPKGEVLKFSFDRSKIFPGTRRDYWVYVPAEYTPGHPACLYVNQDGVQYAAPTVFDNLIYQKEMPVTIGVFVMHGRLPAMDGNAALDRFNRSYEYDGLGDDYARFLLEELLPEVETKKTSDGRPIRLSPSGNDHAIGGQSSGAICAFTVAWERPDQFSRVFSAIGTYVGLRGGERYPTLIRKYEPKPIRIFLQDGERDLNIYGGDWWMANQTMERALSFAGYDVQHVWGERGHDGNQATAIFPDAIRWLWKDWPRPVGTGASKNATLAAILIPGEGWRLAGEGYKLADGAAANDKGAVFFTDEAANMTYSATSDRQAGPLPVGLKRAGGQAFGPDGRLYVVAGDRKVIAYDAAGKAISVASGVTGKSIVVAHSGNIYVVGPGAAGPGDAGKIWLIKPGGRKQIVDNITFYPGGIALSPDQTLLYVDDSHSHWVYSYQVQPDGSLKFKQRYYWLHVPDTADESGAGGMSVDREGRLYVATRLGIQVCDQAGRVNCILPTPNGRVSSLSFGGENFDTLFATCGDRVYKRRLRVAGANAWAVPTKPPAPRL